MSSHSCVHSQLIRYGRLDAACSLHPTRLPALRRSLIVSKITATKAVFGFQFSLSFACGALRSLLFIHRFFHFFKQICCCCFLFTNGGGFSYSPPLTLPITHTPKLYFYAQIFSITLFVSWLYCYCCFYAQFLFYFFTFIVLYC